MVSLWTRGYLKERCEFLSEAYKVKLVYVNPAYTSQGCPVCHHIHPKNREGNDLSCGHCDHADRVGAENVKGGMDDKEIKQKLRKEQVKSIISSRHQLYKRKIILDIVKKLKERAV